MREKLRMVLFVVTALFASQVVSQDKEKIAAGEKIYNNYCQTCHGDSMVSSGQTFDLRRLRGEDRARFEQSVTNGKGQMPPWKGVLDSQQIDQVWNYVRANANEK